MATPPTADFPRSSWHPDLRAELYKQEFYATDAWTNTRDEWVPRWNTRTREELSRLLQLRKEAPAHLGAILREHQSQVVIGYWFELLRFNPTSHPLTTELVHAGVHVAAAVVMYFKQKFQRVRPWVLEPKLDPPIVPLPRHPAYPSGHATQMYLMAHTLAALVPAAKNVLAAKAKEVAVNRERAGLHYPSDTDAGEALAGRIFGVLTGCDAFRSTLEQARDKEWGADFTPYASGLTSIETPEPDPVIDGRSPRR